MSMLRNRKQIAEYFLGHSYKVGAEVGVFDGYYSEILCQTIPGLKLYCIDPWEVYGGYRDHKFESSMRKAEELARQRLEPFDCSIIKKFSVDAAKEIADGSLDFVYIDANHKYPYVKEDIEVWTPKVKKGGVVSGDDYYMTRSGNYGVIQAVHEYIDANGYDLQLTPWDLRDEKEDNWQPQWYFVK